MERKYLEYFDGAFDSTVAEKIQIENWPYVGYSTEEGVVYTAMPEEPAFAYQMVDLGLPSGLKWADRNVGAASPEDAGLYFQWGDTVGYTADQVGVDKIFNWDSYFDTTNGGSTFNKYNSDGGLTVLESIDDAATVHIGSDYRMPTRTEIQELINNTTQTFIEEGKSKGVIFTGSNGNSIFIPAAGQCNESLLGSAGVYGALWASSLFDGHDDGASYLIFNCGGYVDESGGVRFFGHSVRGVQA